MMLGTYSEGGVHICNQVFINFQLSDPDMNAENFLCGQCPILCHYPPSQQIMTCIISQKESQWSVTTGPLSRNDSFTLLQNLSIAISSSGQVMGTEGRGPHCYRSQSLDTLLHTALLCVKLQSLISMSLFHLMFFSY